MSDDAKCATESAPTESVYERAFKALHDACANGRLKMSVPVDEQHDHDCLIVAGLTAGEAAEKRAEAAEREREALAAKLQAEGYMCRKAVLKEK